MTATLDAPTSTSVDALNRSYFGIHVPYMEHIGLRPVSLGDDTCKTELELKFVLTNSRGDVHGGALMSAFDFTLSAAARAHDPSGYGAATIDMTTHFYEPARSNMVVVARCPRRGKSIAFCEGEIFDVHGKLVAVARATFKLIPIAKR